MHTPGELIVADTPAKAQELLQHLQGLPGPYGLDVETTGCDPKKQSPVGTARIVCWSVAWFEPNAPAHPVAPNTRVASKAFLWASELELFRGWLEDPAVQKVGANFTAYDMHAFENHGITVRGVVHDNKHTSRLWCSSKDVRHDLKSQAEAVLGARTSAYTELFSRPTRTKDKVFKSTRSSKPRSGPLAGVPTLTCEGTVSTFSTKKKVLIPLDEVRPGGLYASRLEALYVYAAEDAAYSLELMPYREAQLATRKAKTGTTLDLYRQVWHPMLLQLSSMERTGIRVDAAVCEDIRSRAQADMDALMPAIRDFAAMDDFNPGSPDQLRELLYTRLRCRRAEVKGTMWAISRPKRDEWSTSEVSLHWLQLKHPEYNDGLDVVRRWRKIRRNMQFGRDIPRYIAGDGRVHCVLGPEADTGRLSAKLPALQQIPSKNDVYGLRGAFVARPGYRLIVADYAQLEVYVLAHILASIPSIGDTSLRDALAAGDVYSWIAREGWPGETANWSDTDFKLKGHPAQKKRDLMKIVVLSKNYGKSTMGMALTLLDELGEPATEEFCQGIFDTFDVALPGIPKWQRWIEAYARQHGGVPSLLGRWRPIAASLSTEKHVAARGDRQALNSPLQMGAMDIVTCAMLGLNVDQHIPGWYHEDFAATGARCLLQVHDELIFEVPEGNADVALRMVQHGMEHPPLLQLKVDLKVEAKHGNSWKEAK